MNTYTMLTHLDHNDAFDPARVTIVEGVRYEIDDTPMGIQFEATEEMKWFVAESKFLEYRRQCWEHFSNIEDERTLQLTKSWEYRMLNGSTYAFYAVVLISFVVFIICAVYNHLQ